MAEKNTNNKDDERISEDEESSSEKMSEDNESLPEIDSEHEELQQEIVTDENNLPQELSSRDDETLSDIIFEDDESATEIEENEVLRGATTEKTEFPQISSSKIFGLGSLKISLDYIEAGISLSSVDLDLKRKPSIVSFDDERPEPPKRVSPYIKIILRRTPDILLYEQISSTALLDMEDGKMIEQKNQEYQKLLDGSSSARRTCVAETQTSDVLNKSRVVNTETILAAHVGSYVSNFEMFDTYQDLETSTQSIEVDGLKKMEVITYRVHGVDEFIGISQKPSFNLALMLTMRILASNVYERQQRRFRNMEMPDPLASEVRYRYRLDVLWCYSPQALNGTRCAATDISWCPHNGDILAVAYGIYSFSAEQAPNNGYVCVWNIKNPVNPERYYNFKVPVMSVEFSPFMPQLLAVGLYDGSVQIHDITNANNPPVAVSQRSTSPVFEPIVAIKWIPHGGDNNLSTAIEPLLVLSRDGSVIKYRIINSPYLLGYQQILLDRVEGKLEGVEVEHSTDRMQTNRHPQGLNLSLHPQQLDVYYVLTDEGCVHKCSTNYPHQHLEVSQAHEAAVNSLEFSPWSPKLFLTCGNDWCVRIWMDGIFKPLMTLKYNIGPVLCANWSKTHSTVIIALNHRTVDVWDIGRSTLKPMSSTNIENTFHTIFKLSVCGRSLAVGNEHGNVLMLALEDMPFPPYFQYKQLKKAIYRAIAIDADLEAKVKSIGDFGYSDRAKRKP